MADKALQAARKQAIDLQATYPSLPAEAQRWDGGWCTSAVAAGIDLVSIRHRD